MRQRFSLFIAAIMALGLTIAGPPSVHADDGTFARGYPVSTWPTTADVSRATQLASKMTQDVLRELLRDDDGSYQDGCFSDAFTCSAGTGFNVNVSAGWCFYDYDTGADSEHSAFRVLHLSSAEAATDWSANPGAATYYVHVAYGEATADGIEASDPQYTISTDSSLAGSYTVCSIGVAGAEPDASTYTYTDLRYVFNGPEFAPNGGPVGDARVHVASVTVDTDSERTAGAHAIVTLPTSAVVEDVWIDVDTLEATGTKTVDVGPAGTAAGYADDASVAAGAIVRPQAAVTTGTSETYFSANTRGTLLSDYLVGTDADGDFGLYREKPDTASGGLVVSYTVPSGDWTEFVGTFYVRYVELQ